MLLAAAACNSALVAVLVQSSSSHLIQFGLSTGFLWLRTGFLVALLMQISMRSTSFTIYCSRPENALSTANTLATKTPVKTFDAYATNIRSTSYPVTIPTISCWVKAGVIWKSAGWLGWHAEVTVDQAPRGPTNGGSLWDKPHVRS